MRFAYRNIIEFPTTYIPSVLLYFVLLVRSSVRELRLYGGNEDLSWQRRSICVYKALIVYTNFLVLKHNIILIVLALSILCWWCKGAFSFPMGNIYIEYLKYILEYIGRILWLYNSESLSVFSTNFIHFLLIYFF